MTSVVSERHVGPVRLARAVVPAVREDGAARRIVAVGLALRLAIVAAAWTWSVLGDGDDPARALVTIVTAVVVVTWTSAGAFAKVALLAALDARAAGRPLSARQSWAIAWARRRAIVGLVLAIRRRKFEWWVPPWAFALPVLATQDVDLAEAEHRSMEVYRARWGTAEVEAGSSLAVAFTGLGMATVIAFAALAIGDPVSLIGLIGALVLLVAAMTAATMLRAALALAAYRDQVDGEAPFGLTTAELCQLVGPRTQ
jgi:hypothetical protein